MTERRPYFWRVLRQDFLDLCDRNTTAALLLDYFYSNEINSMARRSQGGRDDGFYELSTSFAMAVVLIDVGKNMTKTALALLTAKGFITPHPDNGRAGWQNRNRYRPNTQVILRAADEWAVSHPGMGAGMSELVQPDQSMGPARPINGSVQTNQLVQTDQSIGPAGPQDLVSKQVKESTPPPTTTEAVAVSIEISEINKLIASLIERAPLEGQRQQVLGWLRIHSAERVRDAFAIAAANDKRNLNYVEGVLKNGSPAKVNGNTPAAPRKYFEAPDEPTEFVTVERMREIRRQAEAKRRLSDGGAS